MRIGLNLLFLIPGEVGGTQTYSTSLIDAFSQIDHQNEYLLFVNRETQILNWPTQENFQVISCPIRASNRPWRLIWEQTVFPRFVKDYHIDVVHSLGFISPLFTSIPTVVTIHDLNYRFIPQSFTILTRATQKFMVENSIRRAKHILAVSHFVKGQIVQCLSVAAEKITVTQEAAKPFEEQLHNSDIRWKELADKFQILQPYIIAFSSINPHKNIAGLVKAYQIACDLFGLKSQLLIIGHLPKGLKLPNIDTISNPNSRVITTGYLVETDLQILLEKASLFVFPSLYEGFGLPVLEAMQLGVPVACSNQGSIPEVAGSAAVYFDPENINQIAETISSIMVNEKKQDQMNQLGYERVKCFSWERTARETLEVYQRVTNMN